MELPTLEEIRTAAAACAAKLGYPAPSLKDASQAEDGEPFIEIDSRGLHFVYVERNIEQSRVTCTTLEDLLFHIFESITFAAACKFEFNHRIETQDTRRIIFAKQIELLAKVSCLWSQRQVLKQSEILTRSPFDDSANVRATLTRELREQGHKPDNAWQMACARYPLPIQGK